MFCKIKRRKLLKKGTMSLDGSEPKITSEEWVEEECGTPIFGGKSEEVCRSCLKGWTHENNYMLDTEENQALLNKAKGCE